jgi:hypothetical protein
MQIQHEMTSTEMIEGFLPKGNKEVQQDLGSLGKILFYFFNLLFL